MSRPLDFYTLAQHLAETVQDAIECLDSNELNKEFRRDFDGVSQGRYLLAKLVVDVLINGRPNVIGLEECTDPTPYCNACGAKFQPQCDCGPIAENE